MTGWFYGLVKEADGKIRIWEITDNEKYLWGHRAFYSWMLKDMYVVIKDLYFQLKYMRKMFDGKKLDKGTKKQVKKWNKQVDSLKLEKLK